MTEPTGPDGASWRNFHGRRHGKTLRAGQRQLLETRLVELAPPAVTREENPERHPLDLAALFPSARRVWLEIGFGGGEHMLNVAAGNPDTGIIGCEAFINGVAMLLAGIERAGLGNVAIHAGDARDLLDVLPVASLDRVFLLYPDPWPKRKHIKRRFANPENLDALARAMAPGAELRLATDIPAYVRHSLDAVLRHPDFGCLSARPEDMSAPWEDWPGTRYEAKALREGRVPHYLRFVRR